MKLRLHYRKPFLLILLTLWLGRTSGAIKIDLNGYFDTRQFINTTINLSGNSGSWNYFSLSDFSSEDLSADLSKIYSEQNLRFQLNNTFQITLQAVIPSGTMNDKYRLGGIVMISNLIGKKWFSNIKGFYFVNAHTLEYQHSSKISIFPQLEHVYKITFLKERMYLFGFADHNFSYENGAFTSTWVTEHQVGFNVYNSFFLTTELRYNQFLDNRFGVAFGLEYQFKN